MKTRYTLIGTFLLIMSCLLPYNIQAQVLVDDSFSSTNGNWHSLNLSGGGSFNVSNGQLQVNGNGTYAVYNSQQLSGHFYMEVDFTQDDNVGLALFKALADGTADPNNYSLIKVENVNGTPQVSISDKQNGNTDVLDNTGAADKNLRYKNTLDGSTFSVPYTSTNKKLRIFRHANEKFIHFFYQVKKNVDGQDATGWIELAPSKEWSQLNGNFLMGLVAINGNATFDNAFATNKPIQDQNDLNTGFAATWREVNWSGYFGDALVVTFDSNDAPLTGGTRKFIFWEALNNVPAWYLDEGVMYTYEFVETWDGGSLGAHEPMSDRLRRFSKVSLDYDGNDYKIVHWEYVLLDPDYQWPDFGQGTEKPMVEEWYKIYPDGTILRRIRYKAKLDTQFRNWHELTELIVITGNITDPSEHLETPALSIWPINSQRLDFDPTGQGNNYEQSNNDATILAVHMQNHPDLVNVFNDNPSHPDTYAGDPITFYKTWHDKFFHMSHWPINKEQYHSDPFKSQTTWKEQIKHASLAGAGAYENNSSQWTANFQIDPADGRKYREWISYMSLSPKGNLDQAKANVQAWLPDPWNWGGGVTPPPVVSNVALNQPTVSSSIGGGNGSANAVDGNTSTRWESQHGSDPEWIYVDLGENHDIENVVITWEAAYSSSYRIDVSDDATNWSTAYTDNSANGGVDDITLSGINTRYVRVYGTARATQWGHSLYELEVYGTPGNTVSHTINSTAGANGSISPSGNVLVNDGANQSFTISANSGYQINDVLVDNVSVGAVSNYTFNNVTANHTIVAQFVAIPTYTISASAGANGSISPSGNVSVTENNSQSFTISANTGYVISDVLVDNVSLGAVSNYTFNNVIANHTIVAQFAAIPTYTISASAGANGSISPSGSVSVTQGGNQTFSMTPNSGYEINDVLVNGVSQGAISSYTFSNVIANHSISASFQQISALQNVALNQPTSSSSVGGGNGSANAVDGNGSTRWESQHGSDQEWIYVDLGVNHDINNVVISWEAAYSSSYRIDVSNNGTNWTAAYTDNSANGGVDDISLSGTNARYVRVFGTARATQWGHSLYELEVYGTAASPTSYTISSSAGTNGSISPSGNISVIEGNNQSFTISANSGYQISDVLVNNVSVGAVSSYTFNNVTENHSISATFQQVTGPEIGLIQAEDYTAMSGIQTENTSDTGGGQNVGWVNTGDWMEYEVNVSSAGNYDVDFRVAALSSLVRFDLKVGGTVLTSVDAPSTGGWQNWTTVSSSVTLNAGVQTLRIEATGNSWNINWMNFTPAGSSCNINWTAADISISNQTTNWSSGSIDISCASQVDVTMDIEGIGPMENADYMDVYYTVDGGSQIAISENNNAFPKKSISALGVTGNSLELIINGRTSWGNETYYATNIMITNNPGARKAQVDELIMDKVIADVWSLSVFPNPVVGKNMNITLNSPVSSAFNIQLLDMSGKVILDEWLRTDGGEHIYSLNISGVRAGVYLVKAEINSKEYRTRVIVTD